MLNLTISQGLPPDQGKKTSNLCSSRGRSPEARGVLEPHYPPPWLCPWVCCLIWRCQCSIIQPLVTLCTIVMQCVMGKNVEQCPDLVENMMDRAQILHYARIIDWVRKGLRIVERSTIYGNTIVIV